MITAGVIVAVVGVREGVGGTGAVHCGFWRQCRGCISYCDLESAIISLYNMNRLVFITGI